MSPVSLTSHATSTSTAAATAPTTSVAGTGSSTLNQQNFLQLLVAQIQYQDPMNPQSNTDMAAQLAQFTSLQQATDSSSSLAMLQANSLIGSNVNIAIDSKTSTSGLVTGVSMVSGSPQIVVNSANYSLSQVTSVTPAVGTADSGAASASGSSTGSTDTSTASTSSTGSN